MIRFSTLTVVLYFLHSVLAAKFPKSQYKSGEVHSLIMSQKYDLWSEELKAGAFNSSRYPSIDEYIPCKDGKAVAVVGDPSNTFQCKNVDLYNFKSHDDLGGQESSGSSCWGWTSDNGREFVAVGQSDGTAFAEITKEGKLVYIGRLPQTTEPSPWREIRSYKDYMIIGSEAEGHGIQIFDMKKLLTLDPSSPTIFNNAHDLTGLFTDLPLGAAHNVVVHEDKNYAVAVGARPRDDVCGAGLIFIDLTDPTHPTSPGCNAEDGYVHDAQCLTYNGPDRKFVDHDICYGYNEDTLTIYDVTDKAESTILSRTTYEGAAYAHQGWILDSEWQDYLFLDDEFDEIERTGPASEQKAVTYIADISNLTNPIFTGYYKSSVTTIDHNQYVIDGYAYQSNYGAGLRVLDVLSVRYDPSGSSIEEVAYFDIYPEDDDFEGGGDASFVGTWASYAYFSSGFIFVNTIERGGFVVKRTDSPSPYRA